MIAEVSTWPLQTEPMGKTELFLHGGCSLTSLKGVVGLSAQVSLCTTTGSPLAILGCTYTEGAGAQISVLGEDTPLQILHVLGKTSTAGPRD